MHRSINQVTNPDNVIKVMEYNLLAECYTDDEHSAHLNKSHLKFGGRFALIEKEIRESNSDLLFLTEVDNLDKYHSLLTEMGYKC